MRFQDKLFWAFVFICECSLLPSNLVYASDFFPLLGRHDHSSSAVGNQIYVWGGEHTASDVSLGLLNDGAAYDLRSASWSELPPSPLSPRKWHAAGVIGENLIIWGGLSRGVAVNDGAIFNTRTRSWRTIANAPFSVPRLKFSAVVKDRELIVWGGEESDFYEGPRLQSDGARFNIDTNTWEAIPEPGRWNYGDEARSGHQSVVIGNFMYVFGGQWRLYSGPADKKVIRYNLNSRIWEAIPSDFENTYREVPCTHPTAMQVIEGKLLLFCGGSHFPGPDSIYMGQLVNEEQFFPVINWQRWNIWNDLHLERPELNGGKIEKRRGYTVTYANSKLMMFGGYGNFQTNMTSSWSDSLLFDFQNRIWSRVP